MLGQLTEGSARHSRHIWVVDQDPAEYTRHQEALRRVGLDLSFFASVDAMLAKAGDIGTPLPSLLVVDAPALDEILVGSPTASARAALIKQVPFVIVSDGTVEKVIRSAFDHGALDSLRTPFAAGELVTKLDRLTQGSQVPDEPGRLQFNMAFLTVAVSGREPVALTPREFQILTVIYLGENHAASRAELFSRVWCGLKVCNKVLDVHVSKLRKKLTPLGVGIQFVRASGYQVEVSGQRPSRPGAESRLEQAESVA